MHLNGKRKHGGIIFEQLKKLELYDWERKNSQWMMK